MYSTIRRKRQNNDEYIYWAPEGRHVLYARTHAHEHILKVACSHLRARWFHKSKIPCVCPQNHGGHDGFGRQKWAKERGRSVMLAGLRRCFGAPWKAAWEPTLKMPQRAWRHMTFVSESSTRNKMATSIARNVLVVECIWRQCVTKPTKERGTQRTAQLGLKKTHRSATDSSNPAFQAIFLTLAICCQVY